jgi:hypothetical protein
VKRGRPNRRAGLPGDVDEDAAVAHVEGVLATARCRDERPDRRALERELPSVDRRPVGQLAVAGRGEHRPVPLDGDVRQAQ